MTVLMCVLFPLLAGAMYYFVWRSYRAYQNRPLPPPPAPQVVELGPITVPRSVVEALTTFTWQGAEHSPDIAARRRPDEPVAAPVADEVHSGTGEPESAGTSLAHDQIEPSANLYQTRFSQTQCSICIEDFVTGSSRVREMPCGHIFHPECIDQHLTQRGTRCPNCQQPVWSPAVETV